MDLASVGHATALARGEDITHVFFGVTILLSSPALFTDDGASDAECISLSVAFDQLLLGLQANGMHCCQL